MKMKKLGAERVVGVDYLERCIEQARFVAKWFDADLELVQEDAYTYCLTKDEQFDYVLCFGLFYHLKYGVVVRWFNRFVQPG